MGEGKAWAAAPITGGAVPRFYQKGLILSLEIIGAIFDVGRIRVSSAASAVS